MSELDSEQIEVCVRVGDAVNVQLSRVVNLTGIPEQDRRAFLLRHIDTMVSSIPIHVIKDLETQYTQAGHYEVGLGPNGEMIFVRPGTHDAQRGQAEFKKRISPPKEPPTHGP